MPKPSPPEGYLFTRGHTSYVFILLWLLSFLIYADRMVVVSIFPFLKRDWGLSDAQCGALISAVYWAIVLFSFPISIVIDRWSRKKSIGSMTLVWSLATVACAFAGGFKQLLAFRSAVGLGEAGYGPGGTAMISALYPESRRALMIGLWNMAIPLGMASGIFFGGVIASRWGWRNAFSVVALPGLAIGLLFFFVKDYKTVGLERTVSSRQGSIPSEPKKSKMTGRDIARALARTPSLLLTYFGFAGMLFLSISLSSFLPIYFQRIQRTDLRTATIMTGGIFLMAIPGSPLGGWIADRWMKRNVRARLLVPALSAALTAVLCLCGIHFSSGGAFQYALLLASGVTSSAWISSAIAVTQDVVHPGLRAISYGLCVIVQNLLGSSLGPLVTGICSDAYGIAAALMIASTTAVVSCILFYLGSRFYERDLAKVERVALTAQP